MTASEATTPSKTSHRFTLIYTLLCDHHSLVWVLIISLFIKASLAAIGEAINPDGVLYIAAAQQFAIGNFSEALKLYPMPAFPLMIAMVHMIIPDWLAAARVITIAAMVLASIPLYGITARFFDTRAAFWAALFLAIAPEANENALRVIRDPLFLLFTLSSVYFIVKSIQLRHLGWLFIGFLFACGALLFRVEGIVILFIPLIFFLLFSIIDKPVAMRHFALKGAALWLGIPMFSGLVGTLLIGPQLITQNRIDELIKEFRGLIALSAFEKYRQIYAYFREIHNLPPFSGFSHSLPATVRHWMPLIYLIGLIESLVKQLYAIFLIPLWFVLKMRPRNGTKISTEKLFVLLLFASYMLLLYYFLMTRDKMVGRLLFTPAILLYPWVGLGFSLMLGALEKHRFAYIVQFALLIVFIALPCIKNAWSVIKSDRSAIEVGQVISEDKILQEKKIIFSDLQHSLYGKKMEGFYEIRDVAKRIKKYMDTNQVAEIETIALEHHADALVLLVKPIKSRLIPTFVQFFEYKRIEGKKGVTVIYLAQ